MFAHYLDWCAFTDRGIQLLKKIFRFVNQFHQCQFNFYLRLIYSTNTNEVSSVWNEFPLYQLGYNHFIQLNSLIWLNNNNCNFFFVLKKSYYILIFDKYGKYFRHASSRILLSWKLNIWPLILLIYYFMRMQHFVQLLMSEKWKTSIGEFNGLLEKFDHEAPNWIF